MRRAMEDADEVPGLGVLIDGVRRGCEGEYWYKNENESPPTPSLEQRRVSFLNEGMALPPSKMGPDGCTTLRPSTVRQ